jgi:hypothetical protein
LRLDLPLGLFLKHPHGRGMLSAHPKALKEKNLIEPAQKER